MDNKLFDDLMQSLDEALEYTNGNKTKGRSSIVERLENKDDVDIDQLLRA